MFRPLVLVTTLGLAGLAHVDTARAESIFVYAETQQTGVVTDWYNPVPAIGEVSLADHGVVEHLSWSVSSPRDAASGLPTGKRQHRPLVIGVRMSAGTLQLGNALANNGNLTVLHLLFFSADAVTGVETLRRTMTLTNASVSSLSIYTIRGDDGLTSYADVAFTYQQVGIEDHDAQISYEDDWETPIAGPQLP